MGWHEAPLAHRFLLQALDRTFRDLMKMPNTPVGGKPIILAGDFRNVLPVVPGGSSGQIISATLKNAQTIEHELLRRSFQTSQLAENLRVMNNDNTEGLQRFDSWLLSLGNRSLNDVDDFIDLGTAPCTVFRINAATPTSRQLAMKDILIGCTQTFFLITLTQLG